MINKQNLWYVTLFSLIVILCVYYIAMPSNSSLKNLTDAMDSQSVISTINESTELVALRIESDEEMLKQIDSLQSILLNETTTIDEKNDAYESLIALNSNKGTEEDFENIILTEFGYNSFVKISGNQISIVVECREHNATIANKIIRRIQSEFEASKFITIKFQ